MVKTYDGLTLTEKLRKDARDYRWGHLTDAADEIDRLRKGIETARDSFTDSKDDCSLACRMDDILAGVMADSPASGGAES